jgi:hypothetical protein
LDFRDEEITRLNGVSPCFLWVLDIDDFSPKVSRTRSFLISRLFEDQAANQSTGCILITPGELDP